MMVVLTYMSYNHFKIQVFTLKHDSVFKDMVNLETNVSVTEPRVAGCFSPRVIFHSEKMVSDYKLCTYSHFFCPRQQLIFAIGHRG